MLGYMAFIAELESSKSLSESKAPVPALVFKKDVSLNISGGEADCDDFRFFCVEELDVEL